MAATLTAGLGQDSRIHRALSGNKLSLELSVQAMLLDSVNHLIWMLAENHSELQHPPSFYSILCGTYEQSDLEGFTNGADFMSAWTGGDP